MLTREEVIEIADECVFDIVEPDEYHDKREIADSGNLWITERMERFAKAAYRKGVEDSIDRATELGVIDRNGVFASEIRKLMD